MSFAIRQKLSNQANASATGLPSKLFGFNPWAVDFLLKAACIKSSLLCCVCVPFLISPLTAVMNSVNRVLNSSFWASSIVAKVCFGSGQTQNSVSVCVCAACVIALDCEWVTIHFAGSNLGSIKFNVHYSYHSPCVFKQKRYDYGTQRSIGE